MTENLLPCPFCGGVGELNEVNAWWVRCDQCNAETEAFMSPEEATAAWNRRPPPPQSHLMGSDAEPRGRMQLSPGYLNSFETVISALQNGGKQAQDAGHIAHGACLLHAAVELEAIFAERTASPRPQANLRPQVEDETEILRRLADGDTIVFSQDGDEAWFTKGDRAFVGDAIMSLREKGYLLRRCDDEENYRGMSEYDTISDAGRAALVTTEGSDNG